MALSLAAVWLWTAPQCADPIARDQSCPPGARTAVGLRTELGEFGGCNFTTDIRDAWRGFGHRRGVRAVVRARTRGRTVLRIQRGRGGPPRSQCGACGSESGAVREVLSRHRRRGRRVRPDVVHVHNTFASLSSSIFWAAKAAGVPVVLTLHNLRVTCATSLLLRDGVPCELCVGRAAIPAFVHQCGCVGSTAVGAALASAQIVHNLLGTCRREFDAQTAMTQFARDIFVRSRLVPRKTSHQANFVPTLPATSRKVPQPCQLVFAGLISVGKGLDLLGRGPAKDEHQLFLVGEGPDRPALEMDFADCAHITWCGQIPPDEAVVVSSRWLVLANRWYKGLPMVNHRGALGRTSRHRAGITARFRRSSGRTRTRCSFVRTIPIPSAMFSNGRSRCPTMSGAECAVGRCGGVTTLVATTRDAAGAALTGRVVTFQRRGSRRSLDFPVHSRSIRSSRAGRRGSCWIHRVCGRLGGCRALDPGWNFGTYEWFLANHADARLA